VTGVTGKFDRAWALGLLGNRGVETERIVQVLAIYLKDSKDSGKDFDENANTASAIEEVKITAAWRDWYQKSVVIIYLTDRGEAVDCC
jgi:hypothetical protein